MGVCNNIQKISFLFIFLLQFSTIWAMQEPTTSVKPPPTPLHYQPIPLRYQLAYSLAKEVLNKEKPISYLRKLSPDLIQFTFLLINSNLDLEKAFQNAIEKPKIFTYYDIKNLLDAGANKYLNTSTYPLKKAIESDNHWLFDLLLSYGAPVNLKDQYGRTPLMLAVIWDRPDFVKTLLEAGADPNILTNAHVSPLIIAAERGDPEIVSLLLKSDADVTIIGGVGLPKKTALSEAVKYNNVAIVNLLLQYKADPNLEIRSTYSIPLIQIAAQNGFNDVLVALLNAGANINSSERNNNTTALIQAVQAKKIDTVQLLLEYGADKTQRDKAGKTALDYAFANRDSEIIKLLAHKELAGMPELVEG